VRGLAQRPPNDIDRVTPVMADLPDPASLRSALASQHPENVFITTWLRQGTETENIKINRAMGRNLLDVLSLPGSVKHVALVTGLEHYLGPFEAYDNGLLPPTPFREEQPRLNIDNFYYAQEAEIFAAAARDGFGWSVHRPHTIIGYALGDAMNDLGCPIEVVKDMSKSRKLSFLDYLATDDGFFELFVRLRETRIIP
jgi:hypothetical protein